MRPSEEHSLTDVAQAVGVDIGGTKIAAARVNGTGVVHEVAYRATPPLQAEARAVEDAIVDAVSALSEPDDLPVGVGAAGFVDADGRIVRFAPHVNWRDEPLADRLQGRLGRPVVVENDANAAAWAEFRFGAGRSERRLMLITLGTGIGGAMVHDGRLERGAHGMAGEFGHMSVVPGGRACECGNRGCWEQYASGSALRREAFERLSGRHRLPRAWVESGMDRPSAITGEGVSVLAHTGDPLAADVVAAVGTWLGRGIADLVAAVDPGKVVIGGGGAGAGDLLLDPARAALAAHLSGRGFRTCPEIVPADLGPRAGLVGAADLARRSSAGQEG
ncbi:MAG: ROK family protein [Ornithinimicrobium sp.]